MRLSGYEAVIGLEVHAELKTATKIFCSCPTAFGAPPNTLCCPICLGLPGALPVLNKQAVRLAVRAGLALQCEIATLCRTDRKQYFYPDLPKAYQISQDPYPLCHGGGLTVRTEGGERRVRISRIHIEEDAGKLIHTGERTLIDCNRCGIPLIEIVTAPDMQSAEEAGAFLRSLRDILVACGVSDCKMHEGSMRCDVNVSLARCGESRVGGIRSEIKNINSFAFVEKAIDYELNRQYELLSAGIALQNETRRYDAAAGRTVLMRTKEKAADYRYLAEPDLPALTLTEEEIEDVQRTLPELPAARAARLCKDFGLSEADAAVLTTDLALADFFETAAKHTEQYATLINLLLSDLLHYCKTEKLDPPVSPVSFAAIATMAGEGKINSSTAKKLLMRLVDADFDVRDAVDREGLAQIRDPEILTHAAETVLAENPRAVADYRGGKRAALQALLGRAMASTRGRADPILLERLLKEALERLD